MTQGKLWMGALALTLAASGGEARAQHWSRTWAASPHATLVPSASRPVPELGNKTVRQVVRVSGGGARLRLRLSNEMSDAALRIGSVHVALAGQDGQIVAGSDRVVTFAGQQATLIPGHAPLVSDAVAMRVTPLSRLTVSIYFADKPDAPTLHSTAAATGWIADGDQTAAVALTAPSKFGQRLVISGVDVDAPAAQKTVVAFGDSITDGSRASIDGDMRWPDQLANRLQKAGRAVSVANEGIGGNRLLKDGSGPNALARFDRDALAVPEVSHVIVLEGVNDIGSATRDKSPTPPTPDDLIGAYRQMIGRAHEHGVKLILATILPYKGAGYWSEQGEATRVAVNRWIRTTREADGFVDFDKAVADKADPATMGAAYDGGDHLHPNDAGFTAMSNAIDLALLR